MLTYEEQLDRDPDRALLEGSLYFQQQSQVHKTMRRFAERLEKIGIDYAVAGDFCMFLRGYRRFTEIVEVLVTPEGLDRIHRELVGYGYVRPSDSGTSIRDVENGVRIKFLVSVQYPGAETL